MRRWWEDLEWWFWRRRIASRLAAHTTHGSHLIALACWLQGCKSAKRDMA